MIFEDKKMSKDVNFRVGLVAQKDDSVHGVRKGFVFERIHVENAIRQYFLSGNRGFSGRKLYITLEFGQTFIGLEDESGVFEPFVKIIWHCEEGISQEESDSFADYIRLMFGRE